ncbi:GSCOCG00009091001-RA-CDS [Cotesia congregata]|nr:GSCOCG00009091001-RA-CDS [Cotesia congregata]
MTIFSGGTLGAASEPLRSSSPSESALLLPAGLGLLAAVELGLFLSAAPLDGAGPEFWLFLAVPEDAAAGLPAFTHLLNSLSLSERFGEELVPRTGVGSLELLNS